LPLANFRDPKGRIAYSSAREPQTVMSQQTLEQVLQEAGSPVELLRNSQIGPYAFPVVRAEFTNWRDEQRAWRETCALLDQSHHMTDLYIEGPDALKVLSDLAINSFKNFKVNQAKQFVACNHDGYVIGDAILFYLDENKLSLVGRPPAENWVQYHIEQGGYDAKAERGGQSRHVGTLYMELPALRRCPHRRFLPSYELQ
jgi:vanillate/3-O-methylgallate O-demethylase